MEIKNSVAVVTGGNRGLGRHFVTQLIERGAKVYAAARVPESVDVPGAVPLRLDITDPESVAAAARVAADATLLVNNAGISTHTPLLGGDFDRIRLEMETHYFGPLTVTRAFAPIIEANGGGAVVNVLSVLSWLHVPDHGAYSAGKAAGWAMTHAVRGQLAPKGITVTGLHVGYMDTDMASSVAPDQKTDPALVAAATLDAVASGAPEVLADDLTRAVKQSLSAPATR
ncbi:SDR family oxidoreductase [Nonomuraea muscovyensis]|uniref:NAD(P)-dependent dehydrogenase (Short-subunit alcohol dehydrogenase family) n=1 Tax=Nonomuraea muscovyensis TaxID=1124761 RepID=A0A7X0F040_9ACTN|nr:SDR family oxidoreductase [Nonomuraea muscovyensis]MBB6350493.1 NAD(P)-dependent dehydrogenase (short-subunit alcohol dehydrogenase family) [Nonomuraea muscovyensis]